MRYCHTHDATVMHEQQAKTDYLEIAVGYVSRASLDESDVLVSQNNIKNVCRNIGMYYIEGMPEGSYHTAVKLNKKWSAEGIGEIRLIRSFKKEKGFRETAKYGNLSEPLYFWAFIELFYLFRDRRHTVSTCLGTSL